jgi:DNA polymerase I-like protein with 3'-5' exonuclease and polymerase domains
MSIKECFTSRFGNSGYLVEADFSQIEVVVQAYLSQDERMMQDVRSGVDFHCKKLAYVLDEPYTDVWAACHLLENKKYKKMRTDIKTFSFQRAYGAGANAIAESTGLDVDTVKAFIKAEEAMYPSVPQMQKDWIEQVDSSRKPSSRRTVSGKPAGVGTLPSLTGRWYSFVEEDTPEWIAKHGKIIGFKPTCIKNYPIQGFAGELMRVAYGKFNRKLLNSLELFENCAIINTVHDCCLVDVHKDYLDEAVRLLKDTMESTPKYFKECFDIEFNLPLKVEVEYGKNWADMKEYKETVI